MYSKVIDPALKIPRTVVTPLIDGSQSVCDLGFLLLKTIRLYWITTAELQSEIENINAGVDTESAAVQESTLTDEQKWEKDYQDALRQIEEVIYGNKYSNVITNPETPSAVVNQGESYLNMWTIAGEVQRTPVHEAIPDLYNAVIMLMRYSSI